MTRSEHEAVLAAFSYDPVTGILTRGRKKRRVGTVVHKGSLTYLRLYWNRELYYVHRLIWLYMTGEYPRPGHDIHHINGDGTDNRWENLTVIPHGQNVSHGHAKKGSGVSPRRGGWRAYIEIHGELKHLGDFPTKGEAIAARKTAEIERWGEPL